MGVSCSISIRLIGSGWFKTPSKCPIHVLDCSSSVINVRPSLLLIGMLEIFLKLVNSRTTCTYFWCQFCLLLIVPPHPLILSNVSYLFYNSSSLLCPYLCILCHVFPSLWVFCLVSCIIGPLPFIYQVPRLTGYPPLLVGSISLPQYLRCAIYIYLWRRSQTSVTAPRDLWNVLELKICSLSQCGNSLMPSVL